MSSTTESQTLEISIVVPLYNEEESLSELVDQIKKSLPNRSFELIFIDDGSTNTKTWNTIKSLCSKNIFGIKLSKNFGKHSALLCGFKYASGEYIVTIDDDFAFILYNTIIILHNI